MLSEDILEKLQLAILSIAPAEVGTAGSLIEIPSDWEYPSEMALVQNSAPHRKAEFLSGRRCAREAFRRIGYELKAIDRTKDGLPLWPEGYLGSITHSKGYCAALAASRSDFQMIGLDLERTDRLSAAAIGRVLHPVEVEWVNSDVKWASLIFSLKEAFFKAQYPVFQQYGNFHDVAFRLSSHSETVGNARIAWISECFAPDLRALCERMSFRYCFFGDFVIVSSALPVL